MPDWSHEVRRRLSSLHLPPVREAEIVEEFSQHLHDRYRELMAGGASPEEASRLALAEFRSGNVLAEHLARLRQAHAPPALTPGAPTGNMFTDLWQDVRYAARMFQKQPGFAATVVLTLALGIGATTALFSVVHGVLLKPLPFYEPERLVNLSHTSQSGGRNQGPATYFTYRDNQRVFEAIGGWDRDEATIRGQGGPEQVNVLRVTDATLPLLGVQPLLGRVFSKEDDAPGSPLRAILTYGLWQRRFAGAPNVLDQALVIDGTPAEIIGVLPSSFKFPRSNNAVVVLPMQLNRADATHIAFGFQAMARLKPGVTLSQAYADIARMIPLLPPAFERLKLQPQLRSQAEYVVGNIGDILWILFAAVGVVLLIACGNVANLFLVRGEGRQQELALRAALGASHSRLSRALLTDSVVLSLAGGALGLALAHGIIGLLRRLAPAQLPRVDEIAIDLPVLLFTLAVSVLSGALFGLFAGFRFGTPRIARLKESGRSASDTPGRHRTRNALVVAQVALSLVLLIVSGLMIRTFIAMRQVQPGFTSPDEVLTFRVVVPEDVISDPEQIARTHQSIAERLTQLPGVTSVGLSSSITMDGEDNTNPLHVEDFPVGESQTPPHRRFKSFAPGYFETMGNRLVAGRSITWTEIHQRRPIVVVSETFAREYWKEPARALGKRVRGFRPNWYEIIGVVGDERDDGLNQPPTAIVYWPMLNDIYQQQTFAYAVRSSRVGAFGFVREIQQAVWSMNPDLPLAAVQTLTEIQARSMAQTSFAMTMLGIAAGVSLLLGVVGMYGVIAYIVAQRTREIGIRMALGAQIDDIRRMFLRHGLWLTAIGIAIGIGAAVMLTRLISALLFGVSPIDPTTYVAVSAFLAAVALLAMYLPARRASRVDPIIALRADF